MKPYRLSAEEARKIAGPSTQEIVIAAVDDAMKAIKAAAERKERKVSLHGFWAEGGYSPKPGDAYSRAKAELEGLGYKVSFYYKELQFVDLYTIVEW